MAYETFLDASVIPMPSSPGMRNITLIQSDSVGENESPFTKQAQEQRWAGADWWMAKIQWPPMRLDEFSAWEAWLGALRGKANVFRMGNPLRTAPRGSGSISGTSASCVASSSENQAGATYIYTQGWTASAAGVLLPGDYIQIGERLHFVAGVSSVDADSSGDATIEIWPSLRESASGVALKLTNCTGMWRLGSNDRQYSADVARLFGLSLDVKEAR